MFLLGRGSFSCLHLPTAAAGMCRSQASPAAGDIAASAGTRWQMLCWLLQHGLCSQCTQGSVQRWLLLRPGYILWDIGKIQLSLPGFLPSEAVTRVIFHRGSD